MIANIRTLKVKKYVGLFSIDLAFHMRKPPKGILISCPTIKVTNQNDNYIENN